MAILAFLIPSYLERDQLTVSVSGRARKKTGRIYDVDESSTCREA